MFSLICSGTQSKREIDAANRLIGITHEYMG